MRWVRREPVLGVAHGFITSLSRLRHAIRRLEQAFPFLKPSFVAKTLNLLSGLSTSSKLQPSSSTTPRADLSARTFHGLDDLNPDPAARIGGFPRNKLPQPKSAAGKSQDRLI